MKTKTAPASGGRQSPVRFTTQGADAPRSPHLRSGFTLIELLVVMGLIILLAAITISVSYSGLIDNYRTIGAGDRVSRWLVIAKVKAQRDQVPTGVRFYADATGMIREAQYIQAPEAYVPVTSDTTNKPAPVLTITKGTNPAATSGPTANTVTLTSTDTAALTNNVTAGDTLVLPEFRILLKIQSISGNTITLNSPNLLPDIGAATNYSTTAFGFLRSARTMVGEDMLLLTGQTAIDGNLSLPQPSGGIIDVLFAPNGEVLGTTRGSIILWIRDPSLTTPASGNQASFEAAGQMGLVTVYTKTGSVATHPVTTPRVNADPYAATKDGINTGM